LSDLAFLCALNSDVRDFNFVRAKVKTHNNLSTYRKREKRKTKNKFKELVRMIGYDLQDMNEYEFP
jgi:hypothetical protein